MSSNALPGPHDPPIVQKFRYLRDPIGCITECQRRYGDVFSLQLVKNGMVFVCSPELTKEVYAADDDTLAAGAAKIAIFGKLLGKTSTLLLDGAAHLKRRKLMLPRFRGDIMQGLRSVMLEACDRSLASISHGREFSLHPVLHRIAFDVIGRALFSGTPDHLSAPLLEVLRNFANRAVTTRLLMFPKLQRNLGPLSPWGKVVRAVARAREAVLAEIVRRRAAPSERDDITEMLITARHEDGSLLTDEEILDEILTMVAAGHETTAISLTWLSYAVFSRPEVVTKLRSELSASPGGSADELAYMESVIRESLRFYSLIPNGSGRLVKRAISLGGYKVPEGAMITVAFHAVHRRSDVFERPDQFRPERFIDRKYSPYEWVPFGGGTRRCIGLHFAMLEMKLVLAAMVERFRIEIAQDNVKPSWRGAFLTPNKGLIVRAYAAHPLSAVTPGSMTAGGLGVGEFRS